MVNPWGHDLRRSSHMLTVSHLSLSRGNRRLFSDVSFSLMPGQWLHLEGDNGVGKTSLLRLLCGLGVW
ncbi:ATP-binding cassette domain-containing protein, partial [uncultured Limnohabitans sp.]|uniref:ABC transporter ATP-binding protein n=1 Tax=uncultured Limnohabitans sp. TaxID=768543 RepID=UPI00344ECFB5